MGLAGDEHAVVGADEPTAPERLVAGEGLRHTVVAHPDLEVPPGGDAGFRGDPQLAAVSVVHDWLAIDGHAPHRQPIEVEVEARKVLGRPDGDGGHSFEHARGGVIGQLEVVVVDVVPAVAVEGEVGIAEPGCAGAERRWGLCS